MNNSKAEKKPGFFRELGAAIMGGKEGQNDTSSGASTKISSKDLLDFFNFMEWCNSLPRIRETIRQLSLPIGHEEREIFLQVDDAANEKLLTHFYGALAVNKEVYLHQLDENDPKALLLYVNFDKNDLPHPITVESLTMLDDRFKGKVMQMLRSKAEIINDVNEIYELFEVLNGKESFEKINIDDEIENDFSTPWVNVVHSKHAEISRRDFRLHNIMPSAEESKEMVEGLFKNMIEVRKIIKRPLNSKEEQKEFLEGFEPVLNVTIDVLQKYSKNREIYLYYGEALRIQDELYNEPVAEDNKEEDHNNMSQSSGNAEPATGDIATDQTKSSVAVILPESKVAEQVKVNGNGIKTAGKVRAPHMNEL